LATSRAPLNCPVCGSKLNLQSKPPVVDCPSCGRELMYSGPHRALIVIVAFIIALSVPIAMGIRLPIFSIPFFVSFYPALVLSSRLVTNVVPLRYVPRNAGVIQLFRK
jgi:DNA-directed RNA polymerase subunit RPC12/RpoP